MNDLNAQKINLDDLNYLCEVHNSPIGGICSDLFCENNPLLCIMCAVDENSCIRKFNHELITFEEFFKKYEKYLNKKFHNKNLTTLEFINYVKKLNLDEIEKDYSNRLEDRANFMDKIINDFQNKIVETGIKKNIDIRIRKINDLMKELDNGEQTLYKLRENRFDLLDHDNLDLKFDDVCSKYKDLNNLKGKLKILFEDESELLNSNKNDISEEKKKIIAISQINEDNFPQSDYKFIQNLVEIIKFLQSENKLKDVYKKLGKSKNVVHFLDTKLLEIDENSNSTDSIDNFKNVLNNLDTSISDLFDKILKDYNYIEQNNNYSILRRYVSSLSEEKTSHFSYSNKLLFNTCNKEPFNYLDPGLLKFNSTIVKDFQTKNTFMDMICLFEIANGTQFLAYSSSKNNVNLINVSDNNLESNMSKISLPIVNSAVILKIENYRDANGVDYLITLSSDKTINKYKYSDSQKNFIHVFNDVLKLSSMAYTFEIVELEKTAFLLVPPFNGKIVQYKFTEKFQLYKQFTTTISTYTYSMKAFYNVFSDKFYSASSTHDCVLVHEIDSGNVVKTFKTGENNWYLSLVILEYPAEKDYYIISNVQKNVAIFSFNNETIIRKMNLAASLIFKGLDLWNEKYFCVGSETSKIIVYEIETGKAVTTLSAHTKAVAGVKRFNNKQLGDVLISFSTDGTIKLWSI